MVREQKALFCDESGGAVDWITQYPLLPSVGLKRRGLGAGI